MSSQSSSATIPAQTGTSTSKYDTILKTLEIQGVKDFKDDEFPTQIQSLVGENIAGRNSWKGLKWFRPKDIIGYQSAEVIQGIIEPGDIRQGYLGDCYFLSTLASLAEWPDRIKALFDDDKPNPFGCHCVRICDQGEWKQVIIDEYFPCISATKGPAFTKGNQGEIWVMLLEKAWAKTNGSYDGIEAGLTRECLHDFTGAPTQTLWLDEPQTYDKVWETLIIGEANNYAMTCGSTDQDKSNEVTKVGLICGHAYSLLGAYTVTYQGKTVKLVKLRNPWGEREWNGNWKDGDSKFEQLSAQDIQKLGIAHRSENGTTDDGIFFMEYDDFRKYYTDAQICYVYDGFKYSSIKASSTAKKAKYFKMTVTKKGRYFISINQKSKRKYPKEFQKEFKYSTATVVIAKDRKDGTFEYIEGQQKDDREVWTSEKEGSDFEPGVYYIYAKVQWKYNEQEEFVLSSYGSAEVVFAEATKVEYQNFLAEAYFDHAMTESTRPKKQIENGKAWTLIEQTDDGFFYLAVENKSQKTMECEFKLNKMSGLKLRKPFRGQNAKLQLKPNSHGVAVLRVKDYKSLGPMSVSQAISFK